MYWKSSVAALLLITCWFTVPVSADGQRLTGAVGLQLGAIDKLIKAHRYSEAMSALNRMLPSFTGTSYDKAITLQTKGFIHGVMKNPGAAARTYRRAVALNVLPSEVTHQLNYDIGQLFIAADSPADGARYLRRWLKQEKAPHPESLALFSSALYQLKRYDEAAIHMKRAISGSRRVPVTWYELLLSCYEKTGRNAAAIPLSRKAIRHFPENRRLWNNLLSLHLRTGDDARALALQELMYQRHLLDETGVLRLAESYGRQGMPYQAAELLDQELSRGGIEATADRYQLLAAYWLRANEKSKARELLTSLNSHMSTTSLREQLGAVLIDLEQWQEAKDILQNGLESDPANDKAQTQLLLGISHFHIGNHGASSQAFQLARADAQFRDQAEAWLDYLGEKSDRGTPPNP
ncbi:MAG: tetratricopeptide repeat protein [Gammaproteobacteria bacterium]|nr:tetratricopeptide repeat protein [Gammaproteobacteria bacterium]